MKLRPGAAVALVFVTNACLMIVELVASRMIAPRIGVSLYTWTTVIGVMLAGVSLGNYVGGRLADRRASAALLGTVYCVGALACLLILWLNNDLHDVIPPVRIPLLLWVVGYIGGVFFAPSVLFGMVSPIVVKFTISSLQGVGRIVGRIYAASATGSIVGTFAAGFWLIAWLGTKMVVLAVASLLLVLGIGIMVARRDGLSRRRVTAEVALALALFAGGVCILGREGFLRSECLRETNYFCINVSVSEVEGREVHELILDRLVHSYTDLNDPTHLGYGYERTYADMIRPIAERRPNLEALFIGGGGYTFPRYLEATLPESHLVVAEIDPGVTEVAHERLGLPRDTRIVTHNLDARILMTHHREPDAYDIVFGDAFNDYSVPFHLTTLEFAYIVDDLLRDDGLYLVNIIDGGPRGHFLRAYVRTLQQVFAHVAVTPSTEHWRETLRTTYVIAASQRPLELDHLQPAHRPLPSEELEAYLALEPARILTDDHVPVDNLMAPVVEDSFFPLSLEGEIVDLIAARVIAVGAALSLAVIAIIAWTLRRRRARRRKHAHPEPDGTPISAD